LLFLNLIIGLNIKQAAPRVNGIINIVNLIGLLDSVDIRTGDCIGATFLNLFHNSNAFVEPIIKSG